MKYFIGITFIVELFFFGSSSWAAISLSQIEKNVSINGEKEEIHFVFTGNLEKEKVKTEFGNQFFQLSVDDATVYPSKIYPVNGESITKIFAYQYSPKQVRFRFTIKGNSEEFKKKFQYHIDGKEVVIPIASEIKEIAKATVDSIDENKLLEKVLKTSQAHSEGSKPILLETDKIEVSKEKSTPTLTGAKPLPSLWRAFVKLFAVIALFLGVAWAIQKTKKSKWSFLNRKNKVSIGPKVDVLSTHYLGPKRNLTVVKVGDKLLLLGVTESTIQMITDLSDQKNFEDLSVTQPEFNDLLSMEKVKPSLEKATKSVRSMIKSKMEGLKPL